MYNVRIKTTDYIFTDYLINLMINNDGLVHKYCVHFYRFRKQHSGAYDEKYYS